MSGAGVALLPCPFCGTPDPCLERSYVDDASQDSGWRVLDAYDVTCLSLDCGTVLEMPGAADVVAAAWNRRAANAAPIRAGDVLTHDDHARGCAGREYACTCGYDDRLTAALTALRAENAALVADNARLMGMLEGEP